LQYVAETASSRMRTVAWDAGAHREKRVRADRRQERPCPRREGPRWQADARGTHAAGWATVARPSRHSDHERPATHPSVLPRRGLRGGGGGLLGRVLARPRLDPWAEPATGHGSPVLSRAAGRLAAGRLQRSRGLSRSGDVIGTTAVDCALRPRHRVATGMARAARWIPRVDRSRSWSAQCGCNRNVESSTGLAAASR
jgi:hypothetical protein